MDIGKNILEKVLAEVDSDVAEIPLPDSLDGVSLYASRLGDSLARAVMHNLSQDELPDGRLYYNIAKSVLDPSLRNNYRLVNELAEALQSEVDRRQDVRLKIQHADFPEERVNTVIGAASEDGIDWNVALRRMTAPVANLSVSFADDFMRVNAEFRSNAGFDTFVERSGGSSCCPWCAALVGRFRYPDDIPRDVYRRHDNCSCSVTYNTGTLRQTVPGGRKRSIQTENPLHVLNSEQASAAEQQAQQRLRIRYGNDLTSEANGSIIEPENDLSKYIGKPIIETDNQHVREWYYANVNDIQNQIDRSKDLESQAMQAFELRNKYKRQARDAMSDTAAAEELERDRPVPTFEKLLKRKMEHKNMTKEEALQDIIKTSSKTNADVNKKFGL